MLLVGYFSAQQRDYVETMDGLAERVTALGAQVVGRFVQRRGISHGGIRMVALPWSRRTLISAGRVREVAEARHATGASAVIFVNELSEHQRGVLVGAFGCRVFSGGALQ